MRTLIALTLVSLAVAACGYKGALYLPQPAGSQQPSTAPAPTTKP